MSDFAYEMNESREFQKQLKEAESGSLQERQEARDEFARDMKDADLVAQRVGWLLEGNYGYGAMKAARRVLKMSKRANKEAQLTHMVAALEWKCPARMAVSAWKKLSSAEKSALNAAIRREMAEY